MDQAGSSGIQAKKKDEDAKMSDTTHHVVTKELKMDGHHLIEKKQKTLNDGKEEMLVHIRSINEKSYKVTKINSGEDAAPETQIEITNMGEDEAKNFIRFDWTRLWKNFMCYK